jgi:hypothetical protein
MWRLAGDNVGVDMRFCLNNVHSIRDAQWWKQYIRHVLMCGANDTVIAYYNRIR